MRHSLAWDLDFIEPKLIFYSLTIKSRVSIMINFDHIWSGSIAVQSKRTWIALELEGHALGLNSNETGVSGLQCSLPGNKNLSEHNQAPWCLQPLKKCLTLEGHHKYAKCESYQTKENNVWKKIGASFIYFDFLDQTGLLSRKLWAVHYSKKRSDTVLQWKVCWSHA